MSAFNGLNSWYNSTALARLSLNHRANNPFSSGFIRGALGTQGGSSDGVILPLANSFESETNTFVTAIGGATAAEKYAIDRFIKYCKFAGFWTRNAAATNTGIWLVCQGTEAKDFVNMLHPGTKDLTKVSTPTKVAAFDGWTTDATTKYLETGIAGNALAQNSVTMGGVCLTSNAGVSSGYDMGWIDGSGTTRMLLMASTVTTGLMAGACMGATVAAIGTANDNINPSVKSVRRTASANFTSDSQGQVRVTNTNTSIAPVAATTVSLLFAKGAASFSQQKWGLFFLLDGLSDTEMSYLHAACKLLVDSYRYGLVTVQPAGYGDATVTVDYLVHGTSLSAICAAYSAKRDDPTKTVAIVCDYLTESVEQLGGMPANGLNWADVSNLPAFPASGLPYEMVKQANTRQGSTPANTQTGCSVASQSWNIQCRRMLDPTRSTGTLPGLDIPVYFSTGLSSVTKDVNNKLLTLSTKDGRVFSATVFSEEGYDGDLIYLAGLPYTSGREAVGSGKEALNGWKLSARNKPGDVATSNRYDVDPYITPGTPASGLLPDLTVDPGYTTGQAYPSLQAMNFRLQAINASTVKSRHGPFVGGTTYAQPANYTAARYEGLGRYLAAKTAFPQAQSRSDMMSFVQSDGTTPLTLNGPLGLSYDLNNGPGWSTDLGQSGDLYLAAGQNYTLRKAVVSDLMDYMRGMIYWLGASGDSRISGTVSPSFITNVGLDADAFLDMHSIFPLYWPKLPYRREPIYMLNNGTHGGAVLDGIDSTAADGGTPRISTNTISMIQYQAFDYHQAKWLAYDAGDGSGTVVWRQGSFSDTSAGNTNQKTPWPMEVSMPVKADCPNLLTSTCPSMTKVAFSAGRMEFQMALAAQLIGLIAIQAITNGIAVQDVTYSTVRTKALALDSVAPVLTQTT